MGLKAKTIGMGILFLMMLLVTVGVALAESWYIKGGSSGLQNYSSSMNQGFYYQNSSSGVNFTTVTNTDCGPMSTQWKVSGAGACVNPNFANRTDFGVFSDNGFLWWHPNNAVSGPMLKFTAPHTGEYFYNVTFYKYTGGNNVNFYIRSGNNVVYNTGTLVYNVNLSGGSTDLRRSSVNLSQGQELVFIALTTDSNAGDSSGIMLNITTGPAPPPEPDTKILQITAKDTFNNSLITNFSALLKPEDETISTTNGSIYFTINTTLNNYSFRNITVFNAKINTGIYGNVTIYEWNISNSLEANLTRIAPFEPEIILNTNNFFTSISTSTVNQYLDSTKRFNITFFDDALLYAYQINITNSTGHSKYSKLNTTLTGTTTTFTEAINTSAWETGLYNIGIILADAHTSKAITDYRVTPRKSSITFKTETDNNVKIETQEPSTISAEKLVDRYTFTMNFDDGQTKTRSFRVKTDKCELDYLPHSSYQAHFVTFCDGQGNWIDFEGMEGIITVEKLDDYDYRVTIANVPPTITFNSIGSLNVVTRNYTWYKGEYELNSPAFAIGDTATATIQLTTGASTYSFENSSETWSFVTGILSQAWSSKGLYSVRIPGATTSEGISKDIDLTGVNHITFDYYNVDYNIDLFSIGIYPSVQTKTVPLGSGSLTMDIARVGEYTVFIGRDGCVGTCSGAYFNGGYIDNLRFVKNIKDVNITNFWVDGVSSGGSYSESFFNETTQFTHSFTAPATPGTYNLIWEVTVTQKDNSTYSFNVTGEQTYYTLTAGTCSGNITNINITYWNENTPNIPLTASLEYEITAWQNNPLNTITFNGNLSVANNHRICFTPETSTFNTNVYFKYTTPGTYTHKYIAFNQTFSNQTTPLPLYNFDSKTGVSQLKATVRRADNYAPISNVVVKLQRLYLSEAIYRTVQYDISDEYGLVIFDIIERDADYKLSYFSTQDVLLKTTAQSKFFCENFLCDITQLIQATTTTVEKRKIVASNVYNNETKVISTTWGMVDGDNAVVTFKVFHKPTTSNFLVCNESTVGSSGVFTCNMTRYTGTALVVLDVEGNSFSFSEYIQLVRQTIRDVVSQGDSAFMVIAMFLVIGLSGLVSPLATIVMAVFGLLFLATFGVFSGLTVGLTVVAVIMGIIIGIKVKG